MTFLYPTLLWVLIPLGLLLWGSQQKLTPIVHLLILILLIISLARPVEKHTLQEANILSKDIIIALDVSYSMRATDLSPTRYDFAKETIKSLLEKNPADNIMLIAFTRNPLLLSAPTTDHALINIALQSLNPEFILTKGTSLKTLFEKLATMQVAGKNLILMTDGGEEENMKELVSLLLNMDAHLHILALGTTQGTSIKSKEGLLLKDKQGNLVISRINPLLKTLANSVQGSYLMSLSSPQTTAEALDKNLRTKDTSSQHGKKMQYHHEEWYQFPLGMAVFLFFMLHTSGVKYLLLFFAFFGLHAQASFFDLYHLQIAYKNYENKEFTLVTKHLQKIGEHSLQSQLLLANNYYKKGAFKKAIGIYLSIRSTSPHVKQMIYHNTANAYAQLDVYSKAKIYYTKALQLGDHEDAKCNLNLIVFLDDKKDVSLGITGPKPQSSDASKSESQEKKDKREREEAQPSSGSGGGGGKSNKEEKEKSKLYSNENDDNAKPHPLGSKVYELINKGYILETQPW